MRNKSRGFLNMCVLRCWFSATHEKMCRGQQNSNKSNSFMNCIVSRIMPTCIQLMLAKSVNRYKSISFKNELFPISFIISTQLHTKRCWKDSSKSTYWFPFPVARIPCLVSAASTWKYCHSIIRINFNYWRIKNLKAIIFARRMERRARESHFTRQKKSNKFIRTTLKVSDKWIKLCLFNIFFCVVYATLCECVPIDDAQTLK